MIGYYSNGDVLWIGTQVSPLRYIGHFRCFWANGKMAVFCCYHENGNRIGLFEYYDFDGNLLERSIFDSDGTRKKTVIEGTDQVKGAK